MLPLRDIISYWLHNTPTNVCRLISFLAHPYFLPVSCSDRQSNELVKPKPISASFISYHRSRKHVGLVHDSENNGPFILIEFKILIH